MINIRALLISSFLLSTCIFTFFFVRASASASSVLAWPLEPLEPSLVALVALRLTALRAA